MKQRSVAKHCFLIIHSGKRQSDRSVCGYIFRRQFFFFLFFHFPTIIFGWHLMTRDRDPLEFFFSIFPSSKILNATIHYYTLGTHLIKSSKFCSFSLITFDGLAAISHNNFGKHASRILFANVILSFKSICNNFVFPFDFFAIKSSISFVDGESDERKMKKKIITFCCLIK